MPRGTGLYDNDKGPDEEPDGDDRGEPMQSDAEVDTDKPTPDVIETDGADEHSG